MTHNSIDSKPWESATGPGSATHSFPSLLDDLLSSMSDRHAAASANRASATVHGPSMSGGPAAFRPAAADPATVIMPIMPQAGPPTFSNDTRNDRPKLDDLYPVDLGALSPDETDAQWLRVVNPYAIAAPPPPASLRILNRNRPPPPPGGGTRRRLLCKSKKGGRKSASRKRCRRKAKRSRKAHRR